MSVKKFYRDINGFMIIVDNITIALAFYMHGENKLN